MKVRARKFWGKTKMGLEGILIVMRQPKYILIALTGFLVFSFIFALFQDGSSTWDLLFSGIAFSSKLGLLLNVFVKILNNFIDPWGLVLNGLAILQGATISLLAFNIQKKVKAKDTRSSIEAGGVGAAISLIALGCPTCGTSLIAPFLTVVLGSSAMALVGVLGWIFTVLAAILLLYAVRKLGINAYLQEKQICLNSKKEKKCDKKSEQF
jgi:hypothetical protein